MPRSRRRVLIGIGVGVGLLALVALAALLFLDIDRYKPRFEVAASNALGMDVRVGGRMGIGLFPALHVTADDARILGDQGATIASAKRLDLSIELLPLLRKQIRLSRIHLLRPRISIERDVAGQLNVARLQRSLVLLGDLDNASVLLSDGELLYSDSTTGKRFEATGLDLTVRDMHLAGGGSKAPLKALFLEAELACAQVRTKDLTVSALRASLDGKDGIFEVHPVTMRICGGQATGNLHLDLSGPVPACQLRCSLVGFRVEECLKTLSPDKSLEGPMDLAASLSLQGNTTSELIGTAVGEITMRGQHLTLVGHDLNLAISRFQSSQNFNLVDVGAVFLAGPLGLAVTKGYNFSGLLRGTGGQTEIVVLVSDWRVERGVAQATDAALATSRFRIALQGGLDFVHGRFDDLTVAVVDANGCAGVRQAIRGSFAKPTVEKPHVLGSMAGPVLKLFKHARNLLPAGPCETFYSGSVPAPK